MKTARYLSRSLVAFLLVTTGAVAAPATSDSPEDPYSQLDPDGVPLAITQPPKEATPEEIEALHRQQERAAADKNWLLRDYEQQLQARDKSDATTDQTANLYYQLSLNKALAKLAGLPSLDANNQDNVTSYRTGTAQSGQGAIALRADASSSDASDSTLHGTAFKPLITPLSAPEAAGMHNFYSSLPVAMAPPLPLSGIVPSTAPTPQASSFQDFSDIDTPGMVAAKKDPLSDMSSSDLTLDILPGETAEQARAQQESNATKLELPLPMDANQLHKQQTAALSVPGVPVAPTTATPAPVKAVPIVDPEAPMPVNSIPPISPVRAPIASPYDILNR